MLAWNDSRLALRRITISHTIIIISEQRFSTVCNFKLIGDRKSRIRFAEGSDALKEATESIVNDYINKDVDVTTQKDILSNIKPQVIHTRQKFNDK